MTVICVCCRHPSWEWKWIWSWNSWMFNSGCGNDCRWNSKATEIWRSFRSYCQLSPHWPFPVGLSSQACSNARVNSLP